MAEEEEEEETPEERGADNLTNPIFIAHVAIKMGMMHPHAGHLGKKLSSQGRPNFYLLGIYSIRDCASKARCLEAENWLCVGQFCI